MIGVVIMEKQKFIVRCDRAEVFYGKPKGSDRGGHMRWMKTKNERR